MEKTIFIFVFFYKRFSLITSWIIDLSDFQYSRTHYIYDKQKKKNKINARKRIDQHDVRDVQQILPPLQFIYLGYLSFEVI